MRIIGRTVNVLHIAFWKALVQHNALGVAKGIAYSGILTVFPALLVFAAMLDSFGRTQELVDLVSFAIGWALPPGPAAAAVDYFEAQHTRPIGHLVTALFIMLFAASGMMASAMEGFRNVYGVPNEWGFWQEQGISFLLVFLALLPMTFATVIIVFGVYIEDWLNYQVGFARAYILLAFTFGRWATAIITGVAVLALVYHFGLPRREPWYRVLPGAVIGTILWFVATLAFGWYVTRFAAYNLVYGPLAAAIALLVWLYIVSIVVLVGAEVNALLYPRKIQVTRSGV